MITSESTPVRTHPSNARALPSLARRGLIVMGLGIVIGLCGLLSSVWHGRQASAINAQVNAGRANAASNTPPLPVAGVDHAMQRAEVWQERSRLISRMSTWTMWILVFAGAGLQATAARRRRAASQGG